MFRGITDATGLRWSFEAWKTLKLGQAIGRE